MAKTVEARVTPRLRFPDFRNSGYWETTTLGAIVTILKGKGVAKSDVVSDGLLPCIRYGELYTRYGEVIDAVYSRTNAPISELFLSRKHDVLIPASGETKLDIATAACVLHDGVALGSDLNVLRTSRSGNGVFLSYLINSSKRKEIARVAQGDSVVHLYPSQLQNIVVPLPDPSEQQKIAECLTSLDDVIAAQARKVEALKAHKRGLMQRLFPREGETVPPLRLPEFRDAKAWEGRTLSQLLRERKRRNRDLKYGPMDVLSVSGEYGCVNQIELLGRSYAGASVKDYHVVQTGDLVYTKSPLKRNPFGIIKANKGRAGIVSTLYAVYHTTELGNASYLDHYFSRDYHLNRYLQPIVKKGAKNDMKVNNAAVLSGEITVPSIAEQEGIAERLTSLDHVIAAEVLKTTALMAHKSGTMQQLFPSPHATE